MPPQVKVQLILPRRFCNCPNTDYADYNYNLAWNTGLESEMHIICRTCKYIHKIKGPDIELLKLLYVDEVKNDYKVSYNYIPHNVELTEAKEPKRKIEHEKSYTPYDKEWLKKIGVSW